MTAADEAAHAAELAALRVGQKICTCHVYALAEMYLGPWVSVEAVGLDWAVARSADGVAVLLTERIFRCYGDKLVEFPCHCVSCEEDY